MQHGRLIILDGIRGTAALVVLLFHLLTDDWPGISRGYLMVDLFFLLSGFVLTIAFEERMRSDWSWQHFLMRRFRRLWPVIAAGVAIGIAAYAMLESQDRGIRQWGTAIAMSLLLVPTIWVTRDPALFPLNRPHWSLFFELVANIVHALVLVRLPTRVLAVLLVLIAPALALATRAHGDIGFGAFQEGWYLGLLRVFWSYITGIVLARCWQARDRSAVLPWHVILALPLLALFALAWLPRWLGDMLAVLAIFPAIIWYASASSIPARTAPIIAGLGAISYPLYATHWPILNLFDHYWPGTGGKIAAAIAAVLVAALVAWLLDGKRLRQRMRESMSVQSGD